MDYKAMWNEMKSTYEKRLELLDSKGKKGSTAWISAKRFVDVMGHFELKEQDKNNQHVDLSMNDIRAMAEEL